MAYEMRMVGQTARGREKNHFFYFHLVILCIRLIEGQSIVEATVCQKKQRFPAIVVSRQFSVLLLIFDQPLVTLNVCVCVCSARSEMNGMFEAIFIIVCLFSFVTFFI